MLRDYLRAEPDLDVETTSDLPSAAELVRGGPPFSVILLDYNMPGMQGLAGLQALREIAPETRIAIISGTATPEVARQARAAGASGFFPKTVTPQALVGAIRAIAQGAEYEAGAFLPDDRMATHPLAAQLSPRELEVLERICRGLPNKEIARDLDIREPTVKLHVKTLYRKIGAANRTQAAMIAKQQGLF
ncbi:two component transcriptional regulator, LuxR family [Palleronia marisminoris]|uniref:Nitrate/nitrite response regulator protein NarL n=2 Tax=Palleronia marisminoris TaxID=315423 RepID=A0A1Y5SI71_9RHOB|nr:two component transcriptional regulator, LuxR family [Palleronia marisminoris]SLN41416.1 Nitrate/nitrite response regulator protein NarL [Palleronia marisminoris]